MDAPCGRCKSYLEFYYMNLDDEKKYLSLRLKIVKNVATFGKSKKNF
jgi:hypothetical protein